MGFFSAAVALFSPGGVCQRERFPEERPSNNGDEPKSTILVIDDDPAVLLTVKTLLGKRGFNVLSTSSSPKGLDLLRYAARDIRIVVLDYSMPKLNGDETLKFIKQLSPNAKVIGLTAMKLDSLSREYLDGIDELLSKPVVAATLFDAIDKVLGDEQTVSAAGRTSFRPMEHKEDQMKEPISGETNAPTRKWFVTRLLIIGLSAAGAVPVALDLQSHGSEGMPWCFVLIPFFFFFIFFFITSWLNFRRDVSWREWRVPSWYDAPFIPFRTRMDQPLKHLHLAAFCLMAFGIVTLIMGSWDLSAGAPPALMFLSAGFGVWAFVRIFCLVFGQKMEDSQSSAPPNSCPVDFKPVGSRQ